MVSEGRVSPNGGGPKATGGGVRGPQSRHWVSHGQTVGIGCPDPSGGSEGGGLMRRTWATSQPVTRPLVGHGVVVSVVTCDEIGVEVRSGLP